MEQVDLDEDVDEADYDEQDEEYWQVILPYASTSTCQDPPEPVPSPFVHADLPESSGGRSTARTNEDIYAEAQELTVEGIDSDGRPSRFTFELHEEPQEDYPGPSDHDGSVVACMALAEGLVRNLDERLGDLRQLSGARLFSVDTWPPNWDRHARRTQCLEWFNSLVVIYRAEDRDEILPARV
ncbi:hypothetical protein CLOM_g23176 [Closterium sp. NIES-68]|nr:hypothetical protein CLOM_g23176 [Closterium sp. NIES-68]